MINVRRILIAVAAGVASATVLFIVFISTLLLIQLMVAQFGAGLVALFGVWFVVILIGLIAAFYYGVQG